MKSADCSRCGSRFHSERALAGHKRHCKSKSSVPDIKVIESDSYCYDIECNNDTTVSLNEYESATSNSGYDRARCSEKYLAVQNTIAKAMEDISFNSKKYDKIQGLLMIHVFIEHKKLSEEDTIDLFKILVSLNPEWCLQGVQRAYQSVTSNAGAYRNKIFQIDAFTYSIPRYFTDGHHEIYEGHHFNILSVVSDMMLSMDESDFTFDESNEDHMVFSEPSKGYVCRRMTTYIHETYGEDYYPLPIVLSFDGLILNKISTRNAKPVYIQLACVKTKSYMTSNNIRCIGFAPQLQVNTKCCKICVYDAVAVHTFFATCCIFAL